MTTSGNASRDDGFFPNAEGGNLSPGEHFFGYVIERRLGKGGTGSVYLARHEMLDTLFAIKVMESSDAASGDEAVRRFVREAKIAARIQHPNLVRVHDAGFDPARSLYYLVMDYMSGGSLRERIALGGRVPIAEAVEIVRAVASALSAGEHLGIVHRDIKPENIMFSKEGHPKLVDLGIVKAMDEESIQTRTGMIFGTPSYMSPEQAVDAANVDSRADVYSLGIVLFEMLCGRPPYAGGYAEVLNQVLDDEPIPDIKRFAPDVPNWVSVLLFRMCAKDPTRRIASVQRLLAVLDDYAGASACEPVEYAEEPDHAPKPYVADPEVDAEVERIIQEKTRRKIEQRRLRIGLLAALALIALVVVVACVVFSARSK